MEEWCITVVQQKDAESPIIYGSQEGLEPSNTQDTGLTRLEAEKDKGERQVFSGVSLGHWADVYTM